MRRERQDDDLQTVLRLQRGMPSMLAHAATQAEDREQQHPFLCDPAPNRQTVAPTDRSIPPLGHDGAIAGGDDASEAGLELGSDDLFIFFVEVSCSSVYSFR